MTHSGSHNVSYFINIAFFLHLCYSNKANSLFKDLENFPSVFSCVCQTNRKRVIWQVNSLRFLILGSVDMLFKNIFLLGTRKFNSIMLMISRLKSSNSEVRRMAQ